MSDYYWYNRKELLKKLMINIVRKVLKKAAKYIKKNKEMIKKERKRQIQKDEYRRKE